MSLNTWPHQSPHKPSSCTTFMLNSHGGRATTGKKKKKKSLVFMHTGSLQSCLTLCGPEDYGLPGPSVREGVSPGRNTGPYWPILVAMPF